MMLVTEVPNQELRVLLTFRRPVGGLLLGCQWSSILLGSCGKSIAIGIGSKMHFWNASVPPLAKNRCSHTCATLCMEKVSVELEVEGEMHVSHKSVSTT